MSAVGSPTLSPLLGWVFPGASYLTSSELTAFPNDQTWSICLRFAFTASPSNYTGLFSFGVYSADKSLSTNTGSTGTFLYSVRAYTTNNTFSGIITSAWLGIIGNKLYIDGAYVKDWTTAGGTPFATPFVIGTVTSLGSAMIGYIPSFAIYSRTLTAAEIPYMYTAMSSLGPPAYFATAPSTIYWGHKQDGTLQGDSVLIPNWG